jgi:hypothetical protein
MRRATATVMVILQVSLHQYYSLENEDSSKSASTYVERGIVNQRIDAKIKKKDHR